MRKDIALSIFTIILYSFILALFSSREWGLRHFIKKWFVFAVILLIWEILTGAWA